MKNYGTNPPSSSPPPPPPPDFISRIKERGRFALSSLRPWREMFDPQAFSFPLSLGDIYLRIRTNSAYFSTNYFIIFLLISTLALFFNPISLIVFILLIAVWILLFFVRDQPIVICGRGFEESYVIMGLAVVTVVLLLITDSAVNVVGSVVIGLVVVLGLGVLRRTDDLAVDEEAAAAGGWYAAVGESSSRAI